jgi:hypothetical protein
MLLTAGDAERSRATVLCRPPAARKASVAACGAERSPRHRVLAVAKGGCPGVVRDVGTAEELRQRARDARGDGDAQNGGRLLGVVGAVHCSTARGGPR